MTTGNNIVAAERENVPHNLAFETALDRIALKIDLTIKGYEERLTALLAQNDELTERAKASEAKARDHLEAMLAMARVAGKIAENASVKIWTDDAIDAATRVFCCGLPLANDNRATSLVGQIAKGRCFGPDCDCWAPGREVTRAALNAASSEN